MGDSGNVVLEVEDLNETGGDAGLRLFFSTPGEGGAGSGGSYPAKWDWYTCQVRHRYPKDTAGIGDNRTYSLLCQQSGQIGRRRAEGMMKPPRKPVWKIAYVSGG
jgi:hypothetical protein